MSARAIRALGAWLLGLVLFVLVSCGPALPLPQTPIFDPATEVSEQRFLEEVDRTRGVRDCFDVLRDPAFTTADGQHGLTSDELVIGLDLGEEQFAYPVLHLNQHEIVEHTAAGLDLLVCW